MYSLKYTVFPTNVYYRFFSVSFIFHFLLFSIIGDFSSVLIAPEGDDGRRIISFLWLFGYICLSSRSLGYSFAFPFFASCLGQSLSVYFGV